VAVIVGCGTKKGIILTGEAMFAPLQIEKAIPCTDIAKWISAFVCDPPKEHEHVVVDEIKDFTCGR